MTGEDELGESAQDLLREIFDELNKSNGEIEDWMLPDESISRVAKAELEDYGYLELDDHGFGFRPTLQCVRAWRLARKEAMPSAEKLASNNSVQDHLRAAKHVFLQMAERYLRGFEVRDTR